VARDRKRAKQRRERRSAAAVARRLGGDGAQAPTGQTVRGDLPGSLDHASAEVDEFDAALVAGAGGVPVAPEADEVDEQELLTGEDELQEPAPPEQAGPPAGPPGGRGPGGGGRGRGGGGGGGTGPQPSGAPLRGGNRAIGFLRASWAELQRVQWPDRRQVTQATAVVLGFVAIAGAYLGLADFVAKEIVEFIL
jgi:preprotein translocase subunit SecE